jgi:NAD(P)-dependent dehydrogenase (short-subunit alcohol dehydrogenase family)
VTSFTFDFADEASLEEAATTIAAEGPLDLILVATGLLHRANAVRPEKSIRQLDPASLAELFHVNSIGPAIAAKHFLPHLARDGRAVMAFLSARVGSIGDNRLGGWYGYRASKAALNAFVIEASRMNRESIVVSLHPGTVDTRLSMPFQRGLAAGQLQRAEQSADHLLQVIAQLTAEDSGGFFAWDGQRIAY